ncbi:MAG TPA: aspartate--tRNA ligase, partial [Buchnera sp. (in: enterobacteria)]|nr:aspartate--tRNA ligase [Buchnera sp. (in: enterobacteria)]
MRNKYCGELTISDVNKIVILCGWVHRYRNLGKMIFVDMRDREGIVQILFNSNMIDFKLALKLKNEFCIQVTGIVQAREKKNKKSNLLTGSIEVIAYKLVIINHSNPLPIDYIQNNTEELRLKYRYLDLRRSNMIKNIKIRSDITNFIRYFMKKNQFLEIETPILTKSTPEGARDYLIPSRIHPGKYYALPQSPQLFKQLLMIAGFDRYYQIAKCFRDEDLRSDRQPEFTQIDIEVSFMHSKQVRHIMEDMIRKLWKKILNISLDAFPIITYHEAMKRYGSDKPDLRNPMELIDIDDILIDNPHHLFQTYPEKSINRIAALRIPGGSILSSKKISIYKDYVKKYGVKKLYYIKIKTENSEIQNSIIKILNIKIIKKIIEKTNSKNGDLIFFISDNQKIVNQALGALRIKIGSDLHISHTSAWKALWVIDFPMFKKNNNNIFTATHHPFSAPKNITTVNTMKEKPHNIISDSYDMIINGYEVGGGSARNYKVDIQKAIFEILGMNTDKQIKKFGFLIDALRFGAPPHAGIAFGLDRLTMLLTNS